MGTALKSITVAGKEAGGFYKRQLLALGKLVNSQLHITSSLAYPPHNDCGYAIRAGIIGKELRILARPVARIGTAPDLNSE